MKIVLAVIFGLGIIVAGAIGSILDTKGVLASYHCFGLGVLAGFPAYIYSLFKLEEK